ncbi:MAG: citrate synthase [Candidatus Sumerlaeia bacterium]
MPNPASETAKAVMTLDGAPHEFPIVVGTEHEKGIDISALRSSTGYITLDDGYGNTGSCRSAITFIDGEKGILRYRGYPIEQIAKESTFVEAAYLVINGELPTRGQLGCFSGLLTKYEMIHDQFKHHFEGFPTSAHPMAILSAMVNAISCYYPFLIDIDNEEEFEEAAARLLSQVRTIAAFSYKKSIGEPSVYPDPALKYTANFLHMMFSIPRKDYVLDPDIVHALDLLFLLHADHEQNCSTSTVRMVASSGANLFASAAAGICALWGPLHGGANVAVIEMLTEMLQNKIGARQYLEKVKDPRNKLKLMGFGHRVYKNFDPRCKIIKEWCDKVLAKLGIVDPELDLAKELEAAALADDYFIERKLYPNVDFYSGIILRALGIPLDMFTVMFAIGRMPGWIANWREVWRDPNARIYRPRQIYTGPAERQYVPIEER